ncbi:EamA family transporter [Streptacidiphilus monticola]
MTERTAAARPATITNDGSSGPSRSLIWLALGIVYVVWGSTYLAIRYAVETMPPFLSAAARFLVAGVLLAGLVAWRSGPSALRVSPRQLGSAALVGLLLLVGGNGLVVLAETHIPSGLAALLVASVPLWVIVLRLITRDRPTGRSVIGVLLGFAGLVVLTVPGISGQVKLSGVLLVLFGALLWSLGSFGSSRLPMPANPFTASSYEMLAGGLGDLALGLIRGEQHGLDVGAISTASWLGLGYLIVFGSLIAFTAFAWLLQKAPLSSSPPTPT